MSDKKAEAKSSGQQQPDKLGEGPCKEIFAAMNACAKQKGAKTHMVRE